MKQLERNVALGQADVYGDEGNDFPKNECGRRLPAVRCVKKAAVDPENSERGG